MIVNLIGPPCAGKSYVSSQYILEHPHWFYVSIDGCRLEWQSEEHAWKHFKDLLTTFSPVSPVIAESSGLSWRLPKILQSVGGRVYTIALLADRDVLHERLNKRAYKRKIPYQLRMDERQSIDWVLQNIGSCQYPIDLIIRTDEISKEETYSLVSEKIEEIRLQEAKEKMQ